MSLATLAGAPVAVVGAGGLGGPAARLLALAGVPLTIFDGDVVEVHNLARQTLFRDDDLGRPKASLLAARLRALVPASPATLEGRDEPVLPDTLAALAAFPIWVDATDRLATKLWLSDEAVARGVTLIHGGAVRLGGQALAVVPGEGPCLRCLVDGGTEGETCQSAGILGPVVAFLGAAMARLALEARAGTPVAGRFVTFEARDLSIREGRLSRRAGCETCGVAAPARLLA